MNTVINGARFLLGFCLTALCDDTWFVWNSTCYMISGEELNYSDAQTACVDNGTSLLIVETTKEHNKMLTQAKDFTFWTGATGHPNTGFKWLDNGAILSNLWMNGKPDNEGECVRYRPSGLANFNCNKQQRFICENMQDSCESTACCWDFQTMVIPTSVPTSTPYTIQQSSTATKSTSPTSPTTSDITSQTSFAVPDSISQTSSTASYSASQTSSTTSELTSQPSSTTSDVISQTHSTTPELTSQTSSTASDSASQTSSTASDSTSQTSSTASDSTSQTSSTASDSTSQTSSTALYSASQTSSSTLELTSQQTPTNNKLLTTTDRSSSDDGCSCLCWVDTSIGEFPEEYDEMIKSLKRQKNATSLAKRRLISVSDHRTSAQAIGYIGVVVLVVPLALIVACDLQRLFVTKQQIGYGSNL